MTRKTNSERKVIVNLIERQEPIDLRLIAKAIANKIGKEGLNGK